MAEQHAESKHPKVTLQECFPMLEQVASQTAAGKKNKKEL
jgi:hypothetical protein